MDKERLLGGRNRDLFFELTKVNLKVSDQNSALGILWSFLGPASLLAVMYFIFGTRFGREIRAYPLYLLTGIVCTAFFTSVAGYMVKILSGNRSLIVNSVVPREFFIAASFFNHALKFTVEIVICVLIGAFCGVLNTARLWFILPLFLSFLAMVLGIGLILSVFYVFARDVEHIWMLVSRIVFFATPVFYSLDGLPPALRTLIYYGNPLTPFLISFRGVLMGTDFGMGAYAHGLLLGPACFAAGYAGFKVFENAVAEKV